MGVMFDKATGVITKIEDRDGSFQFDIWVPRGSQEEEQPKYHTAGHQGNYWQALADHDEDSEGSMGFVGLDDLM